MEETTVSPMMEAGRRQARDVMNTAARIVRKTADTKTADASTTLSTSLQLMLTTALVDGYEPHEVYEALAGAIGWSVFRLAAADRMGVLTGIVSAVVAKMGELEGKTEALAEPAQTVN